jgi:diguanylate cyclase (GGDEF)-like protein
MSEFEITPKPIKFPRHEETKKLFWRNMVQQKRRSPNLPVADNVRISREKTASQWWTSRNKKRAEEAESESTIDSLTGILNDRGVKQKLEERIKLLKRQGSRDKMSVIAEDMDGLHVINNELGHQAGDDTLRENAKALGESVRETDIVGRRGEKADEFIIILPGSGREEAMEVALRIQGRLKEKKINGSLGVAEVDYSTPEMVEVSLGLADSAMFKSKIERKKRGSDVVYADLDLLPEEHQHPEELKRLAHTREDAA